VTAVSDHAAIAIGMHAPLASFVLDTRDAPPDVFEDVSATDWSRLDWTRVGRPYTVERWATAKREWEAEHGGRMPVREGWRHFNHRFHELFVTDVPVAQREARAALMSALASIDVAGARETVRSLVRLAVWNRVHRVEDAIWDPRGKRALFADLGVKRPRVLFLGAADGYEAMQLWAMYPGGHVLLVDYDEFCKTDRFGKFPEQYPFLGVDPTTGHKRLWYREEMAIDFEVADIRDLRYGREFDIVVSIGLVEHFPDEHKAEAFDFHRRFLKPGGVAIITTPRNQIRGRAFYTIMSDLLNFGYRELMDVWQLGLYAHENGFEVLRAGYIKAHNGLICRMR
jgi:SAM-dependent methyltransferase